jgi:TIR domain
MAYQYDVFLSYPHGFIEQWVKQHFLELFRWHLSTALGRKPEIFFDRQGIASGEAWPERLKHALAHSRCLVPLWAPAYFLSDWCKYECQMFLTREKELKYRTARTPGGIIHPVNVGDGEHFPDYAKAIQYRDMQGYVLLGEGFTKTEKYTEFQEQIRDWSGQVAKSIHEVKPQSWRKRWLDDPAVALPPIAPPKFSNPTF